MLVNQLEVYFLAQSIALQTVYFTIHMTCFQSNQTVLKLLFINNYYVARKFTYIFAYLILTPSPWGRDHYFPQFMDEVTKARNEQVALLN